jgi:geranylgeranyl pyrophosphate synthase
MQPRDWQLPVLACKAVAGVEEKAIPAVSALACAQVGIILIDDMLDEDPRGEYHRVGEGQAANFAAAFLSTSTQAILQSEARPETKLETLRSLNQMVLLTAFGQYLDSQNPLDEPGYWRVVENKSAPFYGAALYLGAVFGGASGKMARDKERIGSLYGEIIQIHDDLNDTMAVPANPDWLQGRSPLPILFAQSVDHPERSRFKTLCQSITEEGALQEAQEIIIRCGAVSYCVDQLLRRYHSAREILQTVELARPDLIESLLEKVVAPVWKLFDAIGASPPKIATPQVRADRV